MKSHIEAKRGFPPTLARAANLLRRTAALRCGGRGMALRKARSNRSLATAGRIVSAARGLWT